MSGPICLFDTWTKEQKQDALKKMVEIAQQGGHQSAMAAALGLKSTDTFYRWKREIPEFKEMADEAMMHSQVFYEKENTKQITGESKGNATSLALVLNNKFRDEYKPSEGSTTNNTTINVLNLSAEEMDYRIAQKLEILRGAGIVAKEPIQLELDDTRSS
jgi:hypothetical protein